MSEPADVDLDALLIKPDAAALMGISVRTLNRLIAAKEIDVVRIAGRGTNPGSVRITRRAIRDYSHRHTDRANANTPPRERDRT